MTVEILAIGTHPDDVEVGIGALVSKLTGAGRSVGILDLTLGELGSRGTVPERQAEAAEGARILGVASRVNAGLPDGELANTCEQQRTIIPYIRTLRPQVLLAPMRDDRHPDHHAAHYLVRDANYFAGLVRIETGQAPHRTPLVYYYRVYGETDAPQFIVDVSEYFETKLAALRAFSSQFYNPDYQGPPTFIASEKFWNSIRTNAASLGDRIGVAYGEALYADGPVKVDMPPGLENIE